jgi:choline kinase
MEIDKCIILASGQGSRIGYLGKVYPKCILPVGNKIPLLETVQYLEAFGIKDVVVSCLPEFHSLVEEVVSKRDAKTIAVTCDSSSYSKNLFETLNGLVNYQEPFLFILGDILYLENPFVGLLNVDSVHDVVMGERIVDEREISKGGIIVSEEGNVELISKKGLTSISEGYDYSRWSGLAFCGKAFKEDLEYLLSTEKISSLEDVFEYRKKKYGGMMFVPHGKFVNINTPTHRLLGSFELACSDDTMLLNDETRKRIHDLAYQIKNDIYDNSKEQI